MSHITPYLDFIYTHKFKADHVLPLILSGQLYVDRQSTKCSDVDDLAVYAKSLANTTGARFVLIGSFDNFDLVAAQGQVARRVVVLTFDRLAGVNYLGAAQDS